MDKFDSGKHKYGMGYEWCANIKKGRVVYPVSIDDNNVCCSRITCYCPEENRYAIFIKNELTRSPEHDLVLRSEYDKLKQHADRLVGALEKSLRLCKKYIEENYPKEHHSGHETVMGYLTPMQQALAEYRKETE